MGHPLSGIAQGECDFVLEHGLIAHSGPYDSRYTRTIQLDSSASAVLTHNQVHQSVVQRASFQAWIQPEGIPSASSELPHFIEEIVRIGLFANKGRERGARGVVAECEFAGL